MTFFETLTVLIVMTALGGYINYRRFGLPPTIGLMSIALVSSLALVIVGGVGAVDVVKYVKLIETIDFGELVFHGFLPFLLFAGSLHVDLGDLRKVKWTVSILSTVGTITSTFIVGMSFSYASSWFGYHLPFTYALLFGALISPTDPIAVLGMIKTAGAPKELQTPITGESLFNDGVGAVIFFTILGMATGHEEPSLPHMSLFFVQQSLGGCVLGWILGWIVFRMARTVDNPHVEVLLSIALCMGSYALAELLHFSGPIAVVVAGLFLGNEGWKTAFSEQTRQYLTVFWEVIDEILNSVLFLLIGLEMLAIRFEGTYLVLGLIGIVCVLLGRAISVAIPIWMLHIGFRFPRGTIVLLIWGGLRGALSIALALLLPAGAERELILTVTYVIVIFSVLVQGTTFGRVLRRAMPATSEVKGRGE
jgi:CPA1 family monovalent cation:H+ antiporter